MDRYFTYDPKNNKFETHATLADQARASSETINNHINSNEWPKEIEGICSGIIIQKATQCVVVSRLENLDDNSNDYAYDYEMTEI